MEFKVKFEDIKTGQILEDAHGNRFKVLDITYENEYYPVRLKFSEVGQRLWIYKSNGAARKFDDRNPAKIITLKSLKPKPME